MVNATVRAPRFKVLATARGEITRDVSDFILRITTNRDLNQFVGSFSLVLRSRLDFVKLETDWRTQLRETPSYDELEDFFRPMTYIQIFISASDPNVFTPVMRGFVDSVGGLESAAEKSAQDRTIVSGSDLGKVFAKQKIFFRPELARIIAAGGQTTPLFEGASENALAVRTGDFTAAQFGLPLFSRDFTPNQFMHEMLNIFIHPYIGRILKEYSIERMGEHLSGTFIIDTGQEAIPIKLFLLNMTTHQGSILNLLDYAKNAPWCEMFLQEGVDRTIFVYRPTPWRVPVGGGKEKKIELMTNRRPISRFGNVAPGEGSHGIDFAQENIATDTKQFKVSKEYNDAYYTESRVDLEKERHIPRDRIKSSQIFVDDSDVFTYFVTYPYEFLNWKIANTNGIYQDPSATSNPFLLRGHTNFYGFRPLEIKSTFSPFVLDIKSPEPNKGNKGPEKQLTERKLILDVYLKLFNTATADAYRYNPDYEKGTLRIVGDEKILIGQYITTEVPDGLDASFYVEGVRHDFTAFGMFETELRLSRGTASINNKNSIVDRFLNKIEKEAQDRDKKALKIKSPNQKAKNTATNTRQMNDKYKGN